MVFLQAGSGLGVFRLIAIDKQVKGRLSIGFRLCLPNAHARPALPLAALIRLADSSGYSSSCASSSVACEYQDRFHPVPTRNPWHHRQWLTWGTFMPRDFNFSNTSRQLCVDSRIPSSIARKCFSPRSFTPI